MSIEPLASLSRLQPSPPAASSVGDGDGFARVLGQVLGGAAATEAQAAQAVQDLATGEADDVHTAVLAIAQADISFRLALELRNRLQEAYQQVTQIQV